MPARGNPRRRPSYHRAVQPPYPGSAPSAPTPGAQAAPYRAPSGPPWPRHDKTPGEPDDDYLVPPDPAIGAVISAQTNRKRNGWYKIDGSLRGQMIALGIVGFLVGGALFVGIGASLGRAIEPRYTYAYDPYTGGYQPPPPPGQFDDVLRTVADVLPWVSGVGGAIFFAALGVGVPWLLRRRRSSYVGQLGVQEHVKYHLLGPKTTVMRFADCHALQVARTRHYYNGAYTGTRYSYVWWSYESKRAFAIEGQYNDTIARVPGEQVNFAFAAEVAWTSYKIAEIDKTIASQGMARFSVGADYVGVGKGFLEIGVARPGAAAAAPGDPVAHARDGLAGHQANGREGGLVLVGRRVPLPGERDGQLQRVHDRARRADRLPLPLIYYVPESSRFATIGRGWIASRAWTRLDSEPRAAR